MVKKKFHPYGGGLEGTKKRLKDKPEGSFLLASDFISKDGKFSKLYWIFPSWDEYLNFVKDKEEVSYYEIIYGPYKHHLYFDIDADENVDDEVKQFVKFLQDKYKGSNYNVLTAHTKDKYSYHIISTNVTVANNTRAKEIANELIEEYTEKYDGKLGRYVDIKQLYKTNQQFRLLGSSKIGKNNPLVLWYGTGKKQDFEDTLVNIYK